MDLGAVGPWAGVAIGVLGAGGGVWGWLSTRTTAKAAAGPAQTSAEGTLLEAQAAFQEALTRTSNTFADVTEQLLAVQRDEIQRLEVRVEDLEDENAKCRKETQALRGEIARLWHDAMVAKALAGPGRTDIHRGGRHEGDSEGRD